jgi:D-tyrosyl-tRNA(Tyr) deacylase
MKIIQLVTIQEVEVRFLIQRVTRASVAVQGKLEGEIGTGFLVLIGISALDQSADGDYLADKLVNLRVFPDSEGRMNRSALDVGAELLLVSQFTLYGDCRKGRRPSFDAAAPVERARELYDYVVGKIREKGLVTKSGVFQAHMDVELVNHGPVTLMLES